MTTETYTIVLADDHTMIREGIRSMLVNELHHTVVAQASNGRETITLVQQHKPEIVLIDITMPELNGIEATRHIVHEFPDIKVIALSMHADKGIVSEMLNAGASGYLLKDSSASELEQAIQTVMRGKMYITGEITDVVVRGYLHKNESNHDDVVPELTPREKEIIQLIAEGKATKEIAALLHVSVSTVDTHRQHIMEKLHLHSVADIVKFAIRKGLTSVEK
ncbi:MAG: response regulator transcription factor [Ignavibacteriales bacterium]|nr:response regulator transcription factor [Ignavibacteriales bacterium]